MPDSVQNLQDRVDAAYNRLSDRLDSEINQMRTRSDTFTEAITELKTKTVGDLATLKHDVFEAVANVGKDIAAIKATLRAYNLILVGLDRYWSFR